MVLESDRLYQPENTADRIHGESTLLPSGLPQKIIDSKPKKTGRP